MKLIGTSLLVILAILNVNTMMGQESFYDYTVQDIEGKPFEMSQLKGKKVLVVNTASKCGFTPQYEGLERIYKKYGGDDFAIVAFPSNDFLGQEPGSNEEIATFCSTRYDVSFPVMSKISVKGKKKHPLYLWLTDSKLNGLKSSKVRWNFQKYLIDEEGKLVGHFSSKTLPESEEIIAWITE